MQNKTYEISAQTIIDIMNNIPKEKWDAVITDMADLLKQTKVIASVFEVAIETQGGEKVPFSDLMQMKDGEKVPFSDLMQMKDTIQWIDDGKNENEIGFLDANNNEKPIGSIKFGEKQ